MPASPPESLPKSTVGQRSKAYVGLGSEEILSGTRPPSSVRVVLVSLLLGIAGAILCIYGYSGFGAPLIAVGTVGGVLHFYRLRSETGRPVERP
jgi:hypothetical protein